MPFGLVTAPTVFTKMMSKLLSGQPNVLSYIDDIQIYTDTWLEHVTVLRKTFRNFGKSKFSSKT